MRSFCYPLLEILSGVQSLNYSWKWWVHVIQEMRTCITLGHAIHDQAIAALLLHPSAPPPPPLSCSSILSASSPLPVPLEAQQAHAQPCQADTSLLENPRTERDT